MRRRRSSFLAWSNNSRLQSTAYYWAVLSQPADEEPDLLFGERGRLRGGAAVYA